MDARLSSWASARIAGGSMVARRRYDSASGTFESLQPIGIGVLLAGFAQQLLGRMALPGMWKIGTRRWAHVHVRVAVLAHDLPSTAEDPHEQRTLRTTGGLLHRVCGYFQVASCKLQTDQVAAHEQCVAIPLFVDVVTRHNASG